MSCSMVASTVSRKAISALDGNAPVFFITEGLGIDVQSGCATGHKYGWCYGLEMLFVPDAMPL